MAKADALPSLDDLYDQTKKLVAAATIDRDHTIPYLANRSKNGKTVYIDCKIPAKLKCGVKPDDTLPWHELAEWIRQNEGDEYPAAHKLATAIEKCRVKELDGDWTEYTEEMDGYVKEVDDESITDVPDDLDLRPYEDENDRKVLREIADAEKSTFTSPASPTSGVQGYDLEGAKKKSSKTAADYTSGPVDKEPCKTCTMFQAPHACSVVRGTISPNGHCKFYQAIKSAAKAKEPEMHELTLFIPITKVDAGKRLVYGVVTAEAEDKSGEICDYATTKPFYEKWSGECAKASDGKSLGNVRAMHGAVAAGKLTDIAFNDEAKQIEVCAKVVDDAEWLKVEEGVYTGFSQGGKYIKRWRDDAGKQRYTAEPIEVSLVDAPCLPNATFAMIKADGTTELRQFKTEVAAAAAEPNADVTKRDVAPNDNEVGVQVWINERLPGKTFAKKADLRQALLDLDAAAVAQKTAKPVLSALADIQQSLSKRESNGDVADPDAGKTKTAANAGDGDPAAVTKRDFTDDERKKLASQGKAMKDGSFPIETKDDLENAIKAFGRAKNKAAAKRHIIKRAKALGATDLLPADWSGSTKDKDASKKMAGDGDLKKGVWLNDMANMLSLLAQLEAVEELAEREEWGPFVNLPKEMRDNFGTLLSSMADLMAEMLDLIVTEIKDEEASEAVANAALASDLLKLVGLPALMKAGAKHSKADKERIAKAHDLLTELDPDCCPAGDDGEDAEKLAKQLAAERSAFEAIISTTLMPLVKEIADRVKNIEDQPLPMGTSSVRVVEKYADYDAIATEFGLSAKDNTLDRLADLALHRARTMPVTR